MRAPPPSLLVFAATIGGTGCERLAGLDDVRVLDGGVADAAADANVECTGTIESPPNEGTDHVPDGAGVTWNANPPTSGTHYEDWAHWSRAYTEAIPRGYLVHNLEHGGAVLAYNCMDCAELVAGLTAIMTDHGQDPACSDPVANRLLVTPDPLLPTGVEIGVTLWDHSYTADCLDRGEIEAFIATYYGQSPEPDNCTDGAYPL